MENQDVGRIGPKPWPTQLNPVEYANPHRYGYGADQRLQRAMSFMWDTGLDPLRASQEWFEQAQRWLAETYEGQPGAQAGIAGIHLRDLVDAHWHYHRHSTSEAEANLTTGYYGPHDEPAAMAWSLRHHRRKARAAERVIVERRFARRAVSWSGRGTRVERVARRPREHRSAGGRLRRGPPSDDPHDPAPSSPPRRRTTDDEGLGRDLVGDIRRALDRAAHRAPTEAHSADSLEESPTPSEWHLLSRLQRIQRLTNEITTVDEIEAVVLFVAARVEWMQRRGAES